METFTLTTPPTFQFMPTIHSHGWYVLKPHTWDEAAHTLGYTLQLADQSVWTLAIHPAADALEVVADGGALALTPDRRAELEARVRWMFRLDEDYAAFYTLCADHTPLVDTITRGAGRLLRCATLWEDLARVLATTNTTWTLTQRMIAKLVEGWGDAHPADVERRAFPSPAAIARASEDDLKAAGLGYRAAYLRDNARQITDGAFDLEGLRTSPLPAKELRTELLKLRGVGDYAANTLLLLLGRYTFVPVDTEARATISKVFFGGEKVTDKQVKDTLAAYQPYAALALYCLTP